uniref:TATA-box-binding protein n=1 Tax=Panagrellus redivivus TaxID=6233 RepID=A0A7E4VP09_PANRE
MVAQPTEPRFAFFFDLLASLLDLAINFLILPGSKNYPIFTILSFVLSPIDVVHRPFTQYEPEIFPALVYRMVSPKVTFMIFHTGKVNITGAKTREDIDEGFEAIYPVLKAFKK